MQDERRPKEICLLLTPYMPVPAVWGGAVETLVENILRGCAHDPQVHFTVVSRYDPVAQKVSANFPNADFCYINASGPVYRLCLLVYKALKKVFRVHIHVLDRYHFKATRLVCARQPDLVIAEGGSLTREYEPISRQLGKSRMAIHLHANFHADSKSDEIFGHVIAISEYVAYEWLKTSTMPPTHMHVLKNCIDISRFSGRIPDAESKKLKQSLGFQPDDFIVLYCGRIVPEKGVRELIEAVTQCPEPQIKLLIIGSPNFAKKQRSEYLGSIEQMVADQRDRIRFTGYIENSQVYHYHAIADLAVVPSVWEEPAGLVAIEAMAAGTPLLVTRAGGLPEYVNSAVAEIVARDRLAERLAEKIRYLYMSPERRAEMSRSGRQEAQKYSLEAYHQAFMDMLCKMDWETQEF